MKNGIWTKSHLKSKSRSSLKKKGMFLLKISISCVLIAWVFTRQVELSELIEVVMRANMWFLLLACSMHLFGFLFSALRWQTLLESQGVHVKLYPLIDSCLVGFFFNIFMPTRIGGDVVRMSDLRQACKSMSRSASTIFVERLLGISVLFLFALCASLIRLPLSKEIPAIWIGLVVGILGIVVFFFVLNSQFISRLMWIIPRSKLRKKLIAELQLFRDNIIFLLSQREALGWSIWYSFLLQVSVVFHFWLIGKALGFDILLLDYFFLIPVQLIILMLPSINGIGLREMSSIVLFGFYGIVATEAVTFAFIDLGIMIVVGLIGCFRFLVRRSIPQRTDLSLSFKDKSVSTI